MALQLTDAKIKGLKAPEVGQVEHPDSVVPGLRVRVGKGTKTFILRKRIGGKLRNLTLGRYNEHRFTLADARKTARNFIIDIEAGRDPGAKRREEKRAGVVAGTVRALWSDYLKAKKSEGGRIRTLDQAERMFDRYVLPELGDRMADTVTRADLTRLIDNVPTGAGRALHARIRAFYSWAMPRLDRLEANPATYSGRPPAPPSRKRVLTDAELRTIWNASDAEPFPWRAAIKLLILTGQRREEVFQAEWSEFDVEKATWTIPPERAKNGIESIVPLSGAALAVLEATPRIKGASKVFPSRSDVNKGPSGFSKFMARFRARIEKDLGHSVEDWRLHDLRRTLATGLQRLGTRIEVTEAVLNHVSGSRSGIVGVYQRHEFTDEKSHALEAWAKEVERIVAGRKSGNVVAIKGAAK
jgi:integrase